jgi:PleD family two-component response regulator
MPKILIADDSRIYVHLISGWLTDRGFEVVVASDAIQAFVMATKGQPDAVILDISMPGGSGTIAATASFGIAGFRGTKPPDLDALVARADTAMYAAKRNGRNRIEFE